MRYRREYLAYFGLTALCIVVLVVSRLLFVNTSTSDVVVVSPRPLNARAIPESGDTIVVEKSQQLGIAPRKNKRRKSMLRASLFYANLDSLVAGGVSPDVCDSLAYYRTVYILKGSISVDSLKEATSSTVFSLVKSHIGGLKSQPRMSVVNEDSVKVRPSGKRIMVELNGSSAEELCEVYQIGQKISESIVELRERLGGFVDINQLREVWLIKKLGTFDTIASQLYLDTSLVKRLSINEMAVSDLSKHPYILPIMKSRLSKLRYNDKGYCIKDIEQFRALFSDLKYDVYLEKYLIFDSVEQ